MKHYACIMCGGKCEIRTHGIPRDLRQNMCVRCSPLHETPYTRDVRIATYKWMWAAGLVLLEKWRES